MGRADCELERDSSDSNHEFALHRASNQIPRSCARRTTKGRTQTVHRERAGEDGDLDAPAYGTPTAPTASIIIRAWEFGLPGAAHRRSLRVGSAAKKKGEEGRKEKKISLISRN